MEKKKDIGALVAQKLREATKTPNDGLWDKINASLDANEKKRRRFLYFLFGGVGLVTLLLLTIAVPLMEDTPGSPNENLVTTTTLETQENTSEGVGNVENDEDLVNIPEEISNIEASEFPSEEIQDNFSKQNLSSETKATTTLKLSEKSKPVNSEKKVVHSLKPAKTKQKDSVTTYVYFNSKDGIQIETTRKSVIDSLVKEPQQREIIVHDSLKTIEKDSIIENKSNPL
ncbi:hypothetical protein ATE92_0467 [Ulvibacter sp. MAR_2010_11]|uniref:hypothetical protein n=1 Tax=Ulvibacter sp. MAR_2010_11 TaxID=1250229 RepID=UPI000C2C6343|nr:hypothetical protein [Ulvibacter sp. MAR_2010_11]PKA82339.1 hypothetical protein ATE92_0467 [Ulvibacter sp. MAR_2010_11]